MMDGTQYQHLWELAEEVIDAKDAEIAALIETMTYAMKLIGSPERSYAYTLLRDALVARAALEMSGGVSPADGSHSSPARPQETSPKHP